MQAAPQTSSTKLYNFSLVICRHPVTGKFLLCQEFANQGFWCPGGGVDAGELMSEAARRETLEEAGVDVQLKGILSVEYNPIGKDSSQRNIVRMHVVFYAEPSEAGLRQLPKSVPDFESVGACWCSVADINSSKIKLRGHEPKKWANYLQAGGVVYPLSLLSEKRS
jgi:8-oxo-dGTP pyrophosphatase MutT (NUDIX family)